MPGLRRQIGDGPDRLGRSSSTSAAHDPRPGLGQQRQASLLRHQHRRARSRPGWRPGAPWDSWDRGARRTRRPCSTPSMRDQQGRRAVEADPHRAPPAPRPRPAAAPPCGRTARRSPGRSAAPCHADQGHGVGRALHLGQEQLVEAAARAGAPAPCRLKPDEELLALGVASAAAGPRSGAAGSATAPAEQASRRWPDQRAGRRRRRTGRCCTPATPRRPSSASVQRAARGRTWPCRSRPARRRSAGRAARAVASGAFCRTSSTWKSGARDEVALRPQLLDQPLERQVLVGVGVERRLAHPAEQLREGGIAARGRARSARVLTKKPISPSVSSRLRPAIGRAHHHVLLPRVAARAGPGRRRAGP